MPKVVQGKTLYQQVAEHIKDLIAQGVYRQGALLPSEHELMKELKVGRITVREGLRILSESGVIRTVKGKGSFVQVDLRQLQADEEQSAFRRRFLESTQLRLLLEPAVAREVALHGSDEAHQEILRHQADAEEFHRTLFQTLHNDLLLEIFDRMSELETAPARSDLVEPSRQEGFYSVVTDHHIRICQAIQDRDVDAAADLMRRHLEFVKEAHEEYFQLFCS